MMGIGTDRFVKDIDENFLCPICCDVLKDPMNCKQGHSFCDACIRRWLKSHKYCPLDRGHLRATFLVRNLTVRGLVENLEVYCKNRKSEDQDPSTIKKAKLSEEQKTNAAATASSNFCSWTGMLKDLDKHMKTCPFERVKCPHEKCEMSLLQRDLEDHAKNCELRLISCEHCGFKMVATEMKHHMTQDCPLAQIPCKNGCLTNGNVTLIDRIYMDEHINDICPKTMIECSFAAQGCRVRVLRTDIDKHLDENMKSHMLLLANQNDELKKEVSRLNSCLQNQVCSLSDQLSDSYIWTISDYPIFVGIYTVGQDIHSPLFWLCGFPWRLRLYPSGATRNSADYMSIYLERRSVQETSISVGNKSVSALFRFTVISHNPQVPNFSQSINQPFCFTEQDKEWGIASFMRIGQTLSRDYLKNNSLCIKCTLQVQES